MDSKLASRPVITDPSDYQLGKIQYQLAVWKYLRGADWKPDVVKYPVGPATFGHDNYLFHVMHVVDPTITWGPTAVATAKEFVEFMATHYPAEIAAAAASPGPILSF